MEMKRILMVLMTGLLLIGVNAFAAGDLIVSGQLGVGTTPINADLQMDSSTNTFGLNLLHARDTTGPIWASSYFVFIDGTSGTYAQEAGGFVNSTVYRRQTDSSASSKLYAGFNAAYIGTTAGAGFTVDNMAALMVKNGMHADFNSTVSLTNGYGIRSEGFQKNGAGGTLTVDDYRHIYLQDSATPFGAGTLNVTDQTGLWIDKQALGGTSNRGIVLNGDEAGSDIVFGTGNDVKLYARSGELYVLEVNGYSILKT
jgi:hypothetical protein